MAGQSVAIRGGDHPRSCLRKEAIRLPFMRLTMRRASGCAFKDCAPIARGRALARRARAPSSARAEASERGVKDAATSAGAHLTPSTSSPPSAPPCSPPPASDSGEPLRLPSRALCLRSGRTRPRRLLRRPSGPLGTLPSRSCTPRRPQRSSQSAMEETRAR